MATMNELKTVISAALRPNLAQFSAQDANNAAINAFLETYNLKDATAREIRAKQPEIFALIEEEIERVLPEAITDVVGDFVEVRTYARDAEPVFEIKGLGKGRMKMGIVEGARGGIYKARRLDNSRFQVPVRVETVGVYVTLEEILLGTRTLAELMNIIRDGFVERIYVKTVEALRTAKTVAPAANIANGSGFDAAAVDKLIRIAGAYGTPIIMGFRSALTNIMNIAGRQSSNPNVPGADLDDIRNRGFVTVFHGVPVVELPNYLVDNNNAEFIFKEGDLFILPVDAKPVKVAMKGDLTIIEDQHPSGSVEQNAHRLVGVGLYMANNVCVYTDNGITGGKY